MDVSNIGAPGLASTRSRAQGTTDAAAKAFDKADKRIQLQRDSVSVQLSSFGKLKSAFSEAQIASRALGNLRKTDTDTDIAKAAGNFVRTFNSAVQTARLTVTPQVGIVDSNRARTAEAELRRSFSGDAATVSDLKKVGIALQRDGTLAIDASKFDAALKVDPDALRSTLARVGQQVDQLATRELADSGRIGRSVNSLDERARSLENRQTEQQAQAIAAEQIVSAQTTRLGNSLNAGAAAYQRIFSL